MLCAALAHGAPAAAPDPIGLTRLAVELGAALPTGAGVHVAQVEAPSRIRGDEPDSKRRSFAPDRTHPRLREVPFVAAAPPAVWGGNHATEVALRFYGRDAPAPDVAAVHVYETRDFLQRLARSRRDPSALAPARVWNHSWIAGGSLPVGAILRQLDREAAQRNWVVVAGVSNGRPNEPLLASAFNLVSVGRSDGGHGHGAARVDRYYDGERVRPHLVAPAKTSSAAAAIVAGGAALLIEAARGTGRAGADHALAIRAALMAGAAREFAAASGEQAYRGAPDWQAPNGLDTRFGAGQLDLYASYRILTADAATPDAPLPPCGVTLVADFGARDTPARASYGVRPPRDGQWAFALLWPALPGALALGPDLDLAIAETDGAVVAASGAHRDRGEHLWVALRGGVDYEVTVSTGPTDRPVPYALAWYARPR